jgi:pyruvate formate lyase activating enzyme
MDKQADIRGSIFKIKRFSIHDGPGIRTSVFLKGCPLNCIWCHSPEGIGEDMSIWYNRSLCIGCGGCVRSCPRKALKLTMVSGHRIEINREICELSGCCVQTCPTNALQFTGYKASVSYVMAEIVKDSLYYEQSGGGITLTGGEPLFQPVFSIGILEECKKRNIHTAMETSLFCEKDILEHFTGITDLFIIDLKLFDTDQHEYYTGRPNDSIKDNFRYLAGLGKKIIVRIPVVDDITNTSYNINSIISFVNEIRKDITIEKVEFNPLTENNYIKLGIPFLLKEK